MPRDFNISGETMVKVKGALGTGIESLSELGLAVGEVRVTPTFYHRNMITDDFGPDVPPDVMWQIAEVRVSMTLIHYDDDALETCVLLSMGNHVVINDNAPLVPVGALPPFGTPLGKGIPLFDEGNCLISLNLLSPQLSRPWRFPASYLTNQPFEEPLGVKAKQVPLNWRCIPYRVLASGALASRGTPLWYRTLDES